MAPSTATSDRRLALFRVTWTAAIATLAPAGAPAQPLPLGYELVPVTSNPAYEVLPRINNRGEVVFLARPQNGNHEDQEIFLYDSRSGILTQLTDDAIQDTEPDINDEGIIVWSRAIGPWDPEISRFTSEIMMRSPDGEVTRITDDDASDFQAAVNSLGQVVWERDGRWICGGPVRDILFFDGTQIIPITNNGWTDRVENQSPQVNDLGQIVWTEYDFCNPPPGYNFSSRILMYSDGQIEELTTTQEFSQTPDINNAGQVVWMHYDRVNRFVDLWHAGKTSTLSDGAVPSINDLGHVAFQREGPTTLEMWLYRDGRLSQIPSDRSYNVMAAVNNRTEIAWAAGGWPDADIRMLRRFPNGDLNCDGAVDVFDIEPFVLALLDPEHYTATYPTCDPLLADFDDSGRVDAFDIEPFIASLN